MAVVAIVLVLFVGGIGVACVKTVPRAVNRSRRRRKFERESSATSLGACSLDRIARGCGYLGAACRLGAAVVCSFHIYRRRSVHVYTP